MSQTRAWTWRHAIIKSDLPATTRHVLLTISCFMNELGDGCYPTQEQLAEATGLSDRAVRSHLEVAEQKGWIKRQEHGFKGQRWRNHEYSASWPETQDVEKGAERGSSPSDQGAEPNAEGAERGSEKVRNDVPTTSPVLSNTSPSGARKRAGGGDFNILWKEWPDISRPHNREAAEVEFSKLSAEDQVAAIGLAREFRRLQVLRSKQANMFPYIKNRLFSELVDAPEIDKDGDFIITPERPEWPVWLGAIREQHGEAGVQSVVRFQRVVRKTRWPEGHLQAAE